jgi:hypothetical protein
MNPTAAMLLRHVQSNDDFVALVQSFAEEFCELEEASDSETVSGTATGCQPDSLSLASEEFLGDPWLSITSTLCNILHCVSHWLVLDLPINWRPPLQA